MSIKPGTKVPALSLPILDGGHFDVTLARPAAFSMLVFYRGLHCPICKAYLRDLEGTLHEFAQRGVEAIAISVDTEARARQAREEWNLKGLPIGYGLSIAAARHWGLYISRANGPREPTLFSEPGLFLVRPDGTLYCASIQTMPFARPSFADVLQAVRFVTEKGYPARGEA